jgi:hypothetical protein
VIFGGNITKAQSHDGPVTDDTPTVGYGFQETAGGQDRQTSLTYPDGREIVYGYGSGGSMADAAGLVTSISDANSFGDVSSRPTTSLISVFARGMIPRSQEHRLTRGF